MNRRDLRRNTAAPPIFLAVAAFRDVRFIQYLHAGDDLSGTAWDHREWTTAHARTELLQLAIETVLRL